ncbi:polysaccharide biosynthesis tyrosine autokinase [filamentous cyanobacterium LEGE 11480]|uniref:non-specific protein-tyrosine kinase n=1 Tax=Romeriopsis navalis LEGE 11480 TaxID=2777977 RepID=A0A928VL01_9CYAN|nr:polysaccharide biosynthesis tyrosine autokinase [Romeriopsis navalis]MBE9030255.1 polysaccharide biosynthesis tyrosine autokinase [Romeriopsis navalis LEGE 11480]
MATNSISTAAEIQEPDLGYGQLLGILLRRRWWLISGVLVGITLGGILGYRAKPTFTSSLQLLVEPNYRSKNNARGGEAEFSDVQVEVDIATQTQLLKSTKLVQRAMRSLQSQFSELNPADPRAVVDFKKSLEVGQVASSNKNDKGGTKIFQVSYVANDPNKAQIIVQSLQKIYQEYNLEQQRERLDKGLAFVNKQLPTTIKKVKQAESRLEKFRRDQQMLDPAVQGQALESSINRIIQEQQVNRTQLSELQNRYADLQRRIGLSPQQALLASRLSQSSRYQSLLNEVQKTELSLAQQRLRFQPGTPEIEQITDLRQKQIQLLRTEVSRVIGAIGSNNSQLLRAGQLGQLDLGLINQLVTTQVELQGAVARSQNLINEERQIRNELQRFPKLLAVYNQLLPDITLNRNTMKQLLQAKQDIGLEIARGGYDWQVVEEPQVGLQNDPSLSRFLLLGSVAGLMVGGMIAFAREAIDDAVHSSEELQKQVTLPLLGMVPGLRVSQNLPQLPFNKPATLTAEASVILNWQPFRDAIDLLYQNMQLLHPDGALKSLVVTSALSGEGKSTLSLALAMSAARLNKRVLLIDADLRRPSLHKLLNLQNEQGLSSLLRSDVPIAELTEAQAAANRSNLAIVTAGPSPHDPAKLLSSKRMQELITRFEDSYDLVLLDAPPVLGMVDAVLSSACTSGTLLVGRLDQVTRSELDQAMSVLKPLNVVGVVANGAEAPSIDVSYVAEERSATPAVATA